MLDPFLGSGTTAVVAEQLKRQWKGCDLSAEYCQWAADRIELVEDWPVDKWLRYDEQNADTKPDERFLPKRSRKSQSRPEVGDTLARDENPEERDEKPELGGAGDLARRGFSSGHALMRCGSRRGWIQS